MCLHVQPFDRFHTLLIIYEGKWLYVKETADFFRVILLIKWANWMRFNARYREMLHVCPWQFKTSSTAKRRGDQTYEPPCGLSPAPLHVYCMSPSAEYGSVCHMFTCCCTMYDLGASHVIRLCRPVWFHSSDQHSAIFNPEIMERKTSVPTLSVLDLIAVHHSDNWDNLLLIWCST